MANELVTLVERNKPNIQALLQGNPALSAERLISLFWGNLRASRALAQCSPESLIKSLLQAAAVGVEANTPLQHACIIPRKGVAQFQMMFRGLMYLGVMHGSVSDWRAEAVYQNDKFAWRPASATEPIIHEPALKDRGPLIGAYSLVFLPNGMARAKWMPIEEINEVRDKYSEAWKAGHTGPWKDRPAEMAIKTVVINHSKQIRMAGPAPVTIGEQTWERGPAAISSFDGDDFDDGELSEADKPRAKESGSPVAAAVTTETGGRKIIVPPSPAAPKLILTPDNSPQVVEGHGAAGDPPTGTLQPTETPPDDDPYLTETDAQTLADACQKAGLSIADRRKLRESFGVDEYESLRQSQVPAFLEAMKAMVKR